MTVTCKIVYANTEPDEFINAGEVDLEKAIKLASEYPWEEQAKLVQDSIFTSSKPAIYFTNDAGNEMTVSSFDGETFVFHFTKTGAYGDVIVSPDITINPKGETPEMVMEWFFVDEVDKHINWEAEEVFNPKYPVVYCQSMRMVGLQFWMALAVMLVHAYTFAKGPEMEVVFLSDKRIFFIMNTIIALLWLPTLVLYGNYMRKNRQATFEILGPDKFHYTDSKMSFSFTKWDIYSCTLVKNLFHGPPWSSFEYIVIQLNGGGKIFITSLMGNIYDLVYAIPKQHTIKKRIYPICR